MESFYDQIIANALANIAKEGIVTPAYVNRVYDDKQSYAMVLLPYCDDAEIEPPKLQPNSELLYVDKSKEPVQSYQTMQEPYSLSDKDYDHLQFEGDRRHFNLTLFKELYKGDSLEIHRKVCKLRKEVTEISKTSCVESPYNIYLEGQTYDAFSLTEFL